MTASGIGPVVLMNFEWDAENRLVAVWPATPLVASVSKKWLYDYDYLGRRVRMRRVTLIDDDPVTWGTTADIDRRFVYDGWLLLLELNALDSNAVLRQYTWGLDLAGLNGSINDRTAAGGIGGLLRMYDTQGTTTGENPTADDKSYYYCYDANGNVGQVLDLAGTGAGGATLVIAVRYEYDPYGNRINTPGGGALDQPFRFSTKYFDVHTAMYYYGYRYYLPGIGRWGSRDPIGETGGINNYRAVRNSPYHWFDVLGFQDTLFTRCLDRQFERAESGTARLGPNPAIDACKGAVTLGAAFLYYMYGYGAPWYRNDWATDVQGTPGYANLRHTISTDINNEIVAASDMSCTQTRTVRIMRSEEASAWHALRAAPLGRFIIYADAHCVLTRDCHSCMLSASCNIAFSVRDRFDFDSWWDERSFEFGQKVGNFIPRTLMLCLGDSERQVALEEMGDPHPFWIFINWGEVENASQCCPTK